jgi:membrane protein implicated in regulation of membrane protease activity
MSFEVFDITVQISLIWMAVAIMFAFAEGFTLGLTFIWFAGGALLAMLMSFFGLPLWVQLIAFIAGSTLMLVYTRPVAIKVFKIGATKTNVDSLVGKSGVVIKKLEPYSMGQVNVKGQIWSAKPEADVVIDCDKRVEVVRIEGVKLIVKEID